MRYYAYYLDGEVVGLNATNGQVAPSAVEITKDEFLLLGGSVPPDPPPDPVELIQKDNTILKAQLSLANAQIEMLNDCLAEVAAMVYPDD